ncbi:MAG: SDR family NAD(P)-dependent oxidoreductase, partial [Anaerolineales bacterium]
AIGSTDMVDVPRLCLVTRGTQTVHAQPEPVSVSQSAAWGMGAVIANEFPQLHCRRIDLSPSIMEGELELFARILEADDHEDQVALRNRQRYVARLKQYPPMAEGPENIVGQKLEKNSSFQVQITTPGILDHLSLKPLLQKRPGAGQVEIGVKATGLNFMNVMSAMGIYPGYPNGVGPLGIECAGIVLRVGEDVTGFDEGDEVVAIAFDCLGSHAITDARLVVKKPFSLSLEEAASLPIAFVTAYYALQYLGRLQKNESVLIHSATGGVGLAAIQLAKRAGAEIFATAGSPEKREYLHNLGVDHVMDSRSLTFAEEIMKATQGAGVDLVLNSLAGNAIAKGLEILRPYGRFLEIGKRDIYQNSRVGLLPFHKNLSYFAIDLDKMIRERPDTVGQLLDDIFNLVEKGELSPLPIQRFPISKVADAFRTMAQARHIGKITISLEDPEASLEIPVGRTPVWTDATYLITGGLGGLGLTFADWLARQGARHLVLMGRNKPSEAAQTAIEQLEASGIKVILAQADVADIDQLSAVFAQIKKICPPLKGVIHAAGLLADGTVLQMDRERFEVALAPKVLGSWNLHLLSANEPLDFFILFSSVAAILGTPGQVNYAAGNAFLDGLARFRRAQNLPALSINWGPWSEIGMASEQTNRGERLTLEGLLSISPQQGLEAMDHLLTVKRPQITVMAFQADQWLAAQPGAYGSSFFGDLRNSTETALPESGSRNDLRNTLLGMEPGRQRRLLFEKHVLEQVAYVLRMPPARLPADKPLRTLGLDSLMSLELRNRLEDVLGISIPAAAIWNYPTVMTLIAFLATKMDIPLETETVDKDKTHSDAPQQVMAETEETSLSSDLDHLSKAELDALLKEELDAIQDFLGDS